MDASVLPPSSEKGVICHDEQRLAWLALNRLTDCGSVTQEKLLSACGGMEALLATSMDGLVSCLPETSAREWLAFCGGASQSRLRQQAHKDLDRALQCGLHLITREDALYPALLSEIHGAPSVLYVQGNVQALHVPSLAIVGSRQASAGGLGLAGEFADMLGQQGMSIVSGLALGIDGAAHRGALRAGAVTVAVVATGLDEVYPRRHTALAADIVAAGGALVSEMPPGTPPAAQQFPRRNRIISGLSVGTLVVEAHVRSGSLITARYALEQGREVFAIPGSVRAQQHRGCHALIRQGATLVETVTDIEEQLGGLLAFTQNEARKTQGLVRDESGWSKEASLVYRCVDDAPANLDALAARSGLSVAVLSAALLDLELSGAVVQQHGCFTRG